MLHFSGCGEDNRQEEEPRGLIRPKKSEKRGEDPTNDSP